MILMCSIRHRRLIAWLALAATLFSAVSPALAAALFSGRADVLGGMLGMPAIASVAGEVVGDDHSAHDGHDAAAHGGADPAPHGSSSGQGGTEHSRHGVFCSLCLPASSTVTVLYSATEQSVAQNEGLVFAPAKTDQSRAGARIASHHPRDPPA